MEENKNSNEFDELVVEEEESKSKKFWKIFGMGALALALSVMTVIVICL